MLVIDVSVDWYSVCISKEIILQLTCSLVCCDHFPRSLFTLGASMQVVPESISANAD